MNKRSNQITKDAMLSIGLDLIQEEDRHISFMNICDDVRSDFDIFQHRLQTFERMSTRLGLPTIQDIRVISQMPND